MANNHSTDWIAPDRQISEAEVQSILNALRGLKTGSVAITVQESRIVLIERQEKRRLA